MAAGLQKSHDIHDACPQHRGASGFRFLDPCLGCRAKGTDP